MKYRTHFLLVMLLMLFCVTSVSNAQTIDISSIIETPNETNRRVQFHYYVPEAVANDSESSHPILVCMPSLGSSGWKFISQPIREFADTEGFILLAPTFRFNERDHYNQNSYLFPAAWSGEAILAMINRIEQDQDLSISTLYFFGFSGGAQFSLRFALWKPELTTAVSAHANGASIGLQEQIPTKFFVSSGAEDNRALQMTKLFTNKAEELEIDITFKEYPGGHWLPKAQTQDTIEFFTKIHSNSLALFNPGILVSTGIFIFGLLALHLLIKLLDAKWLKAARTT